jgi:hypothetical protein
MHEAVCKLAMRGKNHQAGAVEIKSSYGNPAAFLEGRQVIKHRRSALFIVATDDFTFRLVVHDDMVFLLAVEPFLTDRTTVDLDPVVLTNLVPKLRKPAIDADTACPDPLFDLATRAESGIRKHFLEAISHGS